MVWGWSSGIVGMALMALFWLAAVWGIFAIFRLFAGHPHQILDLDPAMEILRERYARGEIAEDEFEARKRTLMENKTE